MAVHVTNPRIYSLTRMPGLVDILRAKWPKIPLEIITVHDKVMGGPHSHRSVSTWGYVDDQTESSAPLTWLGHYKWCHSYPYTIGVTDDRPLLICCQGNIAIARYDKRLDRLSEADEGKLQEAEIIFIDVDYAAHFNVLPSKYKNIKYMQSHFVGVDHLLRALDPALYGTFTLAHAGGHKVGHMISEYVIGHIIAHDRRFDIEREEQKQSLWNQKWNYRMLNTMSIGILGLGSIGSIIAESAHAFGMEVWALVTKEVPEDKRSPLVKEYRTTSELPDLLSSCDYIVNVLPSTPATQGLLDNQILSNCKTKNSVFINVGRGDIIRNKTIIEALDNGWLSHVIADVFEVEPLPKDDPLWQHSKITITPHTAAMARPELTCDGFITNYKKFLAGEPLDHVVDWEKGY